MGKNETSAKPAVRGSTHRIGAPPGPRKADQRRAALAEAARTLFLEKGYDATTMDEIAAAAGFAKGTLYHYFSNKAALLRAIRADFEEQIISRIRPRVEACPADDWAGRIKAWTESAIAAYFELSDLHDVVIYGSGMPFRNAMAESEITKYLAQLIQDGADAGAWQVDDARWTAVIMFYSFRGGCDEAIMGTQLAEEVPGKLNRIFLRMLGLNADR